MNAATIPCCAGAAADATRLRMLLQLTHGPRCIGQLAEAVGITSSVASYHILKLRDAGLVVLERRGRLTMARRVEPRWTAIVRAFGTVE
jgi:ArsR family transcriptional regulator